MMDSGSALFREEILVVPRAQVGNHMRGIGEVVDGWLYWPPRIAGSAESPNAHIHKVWLRWDSDEVIKQHYDFGIFDGTGRRYWETPPLHPIPEEEAA